MERVQLEQLKSVPFTIISDDCWGTEVYKAFDLPYSTPFIGTWIASEDFIVLLKDLKNIMETELRFGTVSKNKEINLNYPMGLLQGGIEIHFMHEKDEASAKKKWDRRKERIVWDNIFVKLDGTEAEEQDVLSFLNLPIPNKLCFINHEAKEKYGFTEFHPSIISVPHWEVDGRNMFSASLDAFDPVKWLNRENDIQYSEETKIERAHQRLNYSILDTLESFDDVTFKASEHVTTSYEEDTELMTARYHGKGLGKSFTYSLEKTETYGIFRTKQFISVYVLVSSPDACDLIIGVFEGKGNLLFPKNEVFYKLDDELAWYKFEYELEIVNHRDEIAVVSGLEFILNPTNKEAGTIELKAIFLGEDEQLEVKLQE